QGPRGGGGAGPRRGPRHAPGARGHRREHPPGGTRARRAARRARGCPDPVPPPTRLHRRARRPHRHDHRALAPRARPRRGARARDVVAIAPDPRLDAGPGPPPDYHRPGDTSEGARRMNLYAMLQARVDEGRPVRVGLIGAGKFGAMLLAQALTTRGLDVPAIADLSPDRAKQACRNAGWPEELIEATWY